MKENIIKIYLFNQEFKVKSQETEEHILAVADMVNAYLDKIQKKETSKNRLNLALLVALNISSEYVKIKQGYENLEKEIMIRVNQLINQIDQHLRQYPCGVRD